MGTLTLPTNKACPLIVNVRIQKRCFLPRKLSTKASYCSTHATPAYHPAMSIHWHTPSRDVITLPHHTCVCVCVCVCVFVCTNACAHAWSLPNDTPVPVPLYGVGTTYTHHVRLTTLLYSLALAMLGITCTIHHAHTSHVYMHTHTPHLSAVWHWPCWALLAQFITHITRTHVHASLKNYRPTVWHWPCWESLAQIITHTRHTYTCTHTPHLAAVWHWPCWALLAQFITHITRTHVHASLKNYRPTVWHWPCWE